MKVSRRVDPRLKPVHVGPHLEKIPNFHDLHETSLEYLGSSIHEKRAEPRSHFKPHFQAKKISLHEFAAVYDVKALTPRQMAYLSFDLYSTGYLDREQYVELAFQAELLPNFDDTIGALTGVKAAPDRPRDFIEVWQDRVRFERTHFGDDPSVGQRTEKILNFLITLDKTAQLIQKKKHARTGRKPMPIPNLPPLSLRRTHY